MKIFEVEEDIVKINENCHLIPELKAVLDFYQDPVPAFAYLHFMTSPESPYSNFPEGEKEDMISQDVGGDFGLDDEVLLVALEKLRKLYETPVQQYYEGQKNAMHIMASYLKNLTESSIVYGKDGNMSEIFRMQKEAGKVMESFLKLERLWTEQTQQKLRGNAELGEY